MRGDFGGAELRHGPIARTASDPVHEIGDELGAIRRMHHLWMELHAIELAGVVGDGSEGRAVRHRDGAEAVGELGDAVAMAHPYRRPVARAPDAMEQRRIAGDLKLGAAEFAGVPAFNLAAEGGNHGLLAIADAEDGNAGVDHRGRKLRRAGLMHRCRSAGEDDRLWQDWLERRLGLVEGHDFRINASLPHPPRDELGVLGAEIDDEHFVRVVRHGVG